MRAFLDEEVFTGGRRHAALERGGTRAQASLLDEDRI